jgi:signal transduction histidine kinase
MPGGSTLSIRTQAMPPHVILSVEDNGCAMDGAALSQVFAPFFATGEMDPHAGLGLSLAQGIVRAHGGSIDVHGTVESGTTVTVAFPLTQQRP